MGSFRICPVCDSKNENNAIFCIRCSSDISSVHVTTDEDPDKLSLEFTDGSPPFIVHSETLIGRNLNLPTSIQNNKFISREHIKFRCVNKKWFITDCNSSNGTYINKERISPGLEKVIHDGDTISLAEEVTFVVRYQFK